VGCILSFHTQGGGGEDGAAFGVAQKEKIFFFFFFFAEEAPDLFVRLPPFFLRHIFCHMCHVTLLLLTSGRKMPEVTFSN
jgi:hypothetical protein